MSIRIRATVAIRLECYRQLDQRNGKSMKLQIAKNGIFCHRISPTERVFQLRVIHWNHTHTVAIAIERKDWQTVRVRECVALCFCR